MTLARVLKHSHLVAAIVWALPITILAVRTGLWSDVRFLSGVSIYAIVLGHLSSWAGHRSEVKVEETSQVTGQDVKVENAERVGKE